MSVPINPNVDGQKFGRLTVLETLRIGKRWHLRCRCDCGREVTVRHDHAKYGGSTSCGCGKSEAISRSNTKHGDSRHVVDRAPEHRIWCGIHSRCCNPNFPGYKRYGKRGIKICEEWQHSYEAFLAHVGRRPSPEHQLERIDNNGNYEPGNVRWATRIEQSNNRRNNHFVEFKGERKTVAEWSRTLNLRYALIQHRLQRGWSAERAFTTPAL